MSDNIHYWTLGNQSFAVTHTAGLHAVEETSRLQEP